MNRKSFMHLPTIAAALLAAVLGYQSVRFMCGHKSPPAKGKKGKQNSAVVQKATSDPNLRGWKTSSSTVAYKEEVALLQALGDQPTVTQLQTAATICFEEMDAVSERLIHGQMPYRAFSPKWIVLQSKLDLYLDQWRSVDPQAAFSFLNEESLNDKPGDDEMQWRGEKLRVFAEKWFKEDPDAAHVAIEQTRDPSLRQTIQRTIIKNVMAKDLSAGLRMLEDDPEATKSAAYADFDPEQLRGRFTEVAKAFGDGNSRINLLMNDFGREWMRADPEGALNWAQSDQFSDLTHHQSPVIHLVSKWVEIDLDSALQFIANVSNPAMKNLLTSSAISDIGSEHPEKLLKWIAENSKGLQQASDFGNVIGSLVRDDPQRATAMLAETPPGPLREAGMQRIVNSSWAQGTLDWLLSLPRDETVNAAFNKFASRSDQTEAAILSYATSAPPNEVPAAFHAVVARAKALEDPDSAVDYVAGLPNDAQQSAARGIIGTLVRSDPEAAATAFAQLPSREAKIASVNKLVTAWAAVDAPAVQQWMQTLTDPILQKSADRVFRHYTKTQ
ncbi:MAG: hypothetical protein KDN22_21150 [Verrucomicrobiae bacterium]|nr:hypothetical protein [Verrucomicrobiae bacterium]